MSYMMDIIRRYYIDIIVITFAKQISYSIALCPDPERHERRHRPENTDDSCHGNVRQQTADLTDRRNVARGRSSQCPTFHEAGLNCGRDDGTLYSNDNNSAADRDKASFPGDVASGQSRKSSLYHYTKPTSQANLHCVYVRTWSAVAQS